MLVIVAATLATADEAEAALRAWGARSLERSRPVPQRVLVRGGPFEDAEAVRVVAGLRAAGWPASDRPEGGGHLTAWQAHTAPVVIGNRLWVRFPWSEATRPSGGEREARRGVSHVGETVVEIDPGGAFGTGAHPSTRLLLEALAERLVGGETVLDVGCGSGVLAIAAVRLGAQSAVAIDLAPAAVAATTTNAARNGVAGQVHASTTPLEAVRGAYDVVVANIGCETLRQMGPDLARLVAPGGWLALSGISPAQVSRVAAGLPGLALVDSPRLDDWAALVARRVPAGLDAVPIGYPGDMADIEDPQGKDPEGGHDKAALDEAAARMKASQGGEGKTDHDLDPPGGHDPEALKEAAEKMGAPE